MSEENLLQRDIEDFGIKDGEDLKATDRAQGIRKFLSGFIEQTFSFEDLRYKEALSGLANSRNGIRPDAESLSVVVGNELSLLGFDIQQNAYIREQSAAERSANRAYKTKQCFGYIFCSSLEKNSMKDTIDLICRVAAKQGLSKEDVIGILRDNAGIREMAQNDMQKLGLVDFFERCDGIMDEIFAQEQVHDSNTITEPDVLNSDRENQIQSDKSVFRSIANFFMSIKDYIASFLRKIGNAIKNIINKIKNHRRNEPAVVPTIDNETIQSFEQVNNSAPSISVYETMKTAESQSAEQENSIPELVSNNEPNKGKSE